MPSVAVTTYLYDAVGNETGPDRPRRQPHDLRLRRAESQGRDDRPAWSTRRPTSYDALDRLIVHDRCPRPRHHLRLRRRQPPGGRDLARLPRGTVTNVQTYTYDADGNILTAQDVERHLHDDLRRARPGDHDRGPLRADADLHLRRRRQPDATQDSLGGVTTYVYDADNELTSEQFGGTGQTPAPHRHDLRRRRRDLDRDPIQRPGRDRRSGRVVLHLQRRRRDHQPAWIRTASATSWPTSPTPTTWPTG